VYGFQLRSLLRRLPGYAAAGAPRGDGRRRGERCTVLYRTRRLTLRRATTRWYADTPDVPGSRGWGATAPRIATLCRLRDGDTGREIGAASTHWDGASAESRRRSAAALLSWLDPGLPWVVAADLNATAGTPAVARLLAGGLRDTLAGLGERGPQAATHHSWDGSTSGTRIDYVLATPEWRLLAAAIRHDRPGGRLPSDHWPVVAELLLD
jgi:endonuclease/exonuclease/phosphatase family metal-dependent hydrolase